MTPRRESWCSERGEGLISGLVLLAGVLLPLLFLIALFGRLESAQLAAQQAARDAVRSATQAPTADQAHAEARAAVARAPHAGRLRLGLTGRYEAGQVLTARVSTRVALSRLPLLGDIGTVTVAASASAPVDRYRSILDTGGGGP